MASAGDNPYLPHIVGDVSMIARDDTMPITIDHEIPLAVVFFQKSKNRIAGKLADAAIAKAHPTRNETFIPLNAIPSAIANTPTARADILPAFTFFSSLKFFLK